MQASRSTLLIMLLLVGTLIAITNLHLTTYSGRNYREDEINSVHGALTKTPAEIVEWMSTDLHPPGWRLFADLWIDTFGTNENIVRWSSILINLISFSVLFQLGKQLDNWKTGLFAVLLLGLYPFAANAMYELRPYAMLIMLSIALHLVFYRWVHKPSGRLMLLYVALGIGAVYTHFFSIFIFAAHAVYALLNLHYNRKHWRDTIAMWIFIGLSFSGWIIPFIHTITVPFKGGIYYAIPDGWVGIQLLIDNIRFTPEIIGGFLVILSLFTPQLAPTFLQTPGLRWTKNQAFIYNISLLVFIVLIAFVANTVVSSLTARNMLILTPLVAMLMAMGLRLLPVQASIILIGLLLINAPQELPTQTSNAPYREMVTFMEETYQTDSIVLTEFSEAWRWLTPVSYFLMDFTPDRMSKTRMYHITNRNENVYLAGNFPELLTNIHQRKVRDDLLNRVIPPVKQLWHLQQGGGAEDYHDIVQSWLKTHYAEQRHIEWDDPIYQTTYSLTEYIRVPEGSQLILSAEDNHLQLFAWSLQDSVEITACQTITIESWWQTTKPTDNPLLLSLILVDDNGQVAIAEDVPADLFTTAWISERYYRDGTQLTIPCDIATGSYNLLLGIRNEITGTLLELVDPTSNNIGTLYYLTTLHANED